jgi:hypothetical protein
LSVRAERCQSHYFTAKPRVYVYVSTDTYTVTNFLHSVLESISNVIIFLRVIRFHRQLLTESDKDTVGMITRGTFHHQRKRRTNTYQGK